MLAPLQACGTAASDNANEAEAKATQNPQINSVAIQSDRTLLMLGESLTLPIAVDATGGASSNVEWTSSDNAVATVDSSGVVTAQATGTVQITAASQADASLNSTHQLAVVDVWGGEQSLATIESNPSSNSYYVLDVAVGEQGNVVVVGAVDNDNNAGSVNGFVVVFDPQGNELWRKILGGDRDYVTSAYISQGRLFLGLNYRRFIQNPFVRESGAGVTVFNLENGDELWSYADLDGRYDIDDVLVDSEDSILVALSKYSYSNATDEAFVWTFQNTGENEWGEMTQQDLGPGRLTNFAFDGGSLYGAFTGGSKVAVGRVSLGDAEGGKSFDESAYIIEDETVFGDVEFAVRDGGQAIWALSEFGSESARPEVKVEEFISGAIAIGSASPSASVTTVAHNIVQDDTPVTGVAFNRAGQAVAAGATDDSDSPRPGSIGFIHVYNAEGQSVHTTNTSGGIVGLAVDDADRVIVVKQIREADPSNSSVTITAELVVEALPPSIMRP